MQYLLFWVCLLSSFVSKCLGQRIECTWSSEYLCGDKCLGLEHLCLCGNESITYYDTTMYNCCNHGTCFKDLTGNVECHGGVKQNWRDPCDGACRQYARYGYNTIACSDQKQCVNELILCRGVPICNE